MRLVLCSEGFYAQNTVDACVKLVGKPQDEITVAIINEAYAVELGDKRWVLDNNVEAWIKGHPQNVLNMSDS